MGESGELDESLVTRVAEAIRDAHISYVRERIGEREASTAKAEAIIARAMDEGDRSCSILMMSLIDDTLAEAFRENLDSSIPGGLNSLLEGFGILSTASARATLALALGWMTRRTFNDISRIRKIRNIFAHQADVFEFQSSNQVRSHIEAMSAREEPVTKLWRTKDEEAVIRLTLRHTFLLRATLTSFKLSEELVVAPAALRAGLGPGSVMPRDFDGLPKSLREMRLTASGIVIRIITGKDPERTSGF